MCGIAGIFVDEPTRLDPRTVAERMQIGLTHRGPDDRGLFAADHGHCVLVHTRLSILDLSRAGNQPMGWGDMGAGSREQGAGNREHGAACGEELGVRREQRKRNWITYNGEIYNYRDLREELGAGSKKHGGSRGQRSEVGSQRSEVSGQRSEIRGREASQRPSIPAEGSHEEWQSNTDTEVIVRAYSRWGMASLQRLRGMFAFGIWDEQKQQLVLARDPFGIKPLYYYQTDGLFLFASEIRALLASGLVPRKLNLNGLASYLQFGSVQDPLTIVDGVRSLPPGHVAVIEFKDGRLKTEMCRYLSNPLGQIDDCIPASRPEAVKLLRAKLEESVRLHLVSDVPLGAFLSGGIDSSALVALMSRVTDERPKTFTVTFAEAEFSEAAHARLLAKTFGTEHREILLSEEKLLGLLPGALEAMDQPTMDGINTFVVSKAVKEAGVTVALSGLGGDELFAGYPSFRRAKKLEMISRTPRGLRKAGSTVGRALMNGSARYNKLWDLVGSDCSPYAAYRISRQLFAREEIGRLSSNIRSRLEGLEAGTLGSSLLPALCSMLHADPINAVSRYELTGYMANTLLRDTDQMSMSHALEVRVPFVDPAVVQFVLGLPGEWKMDGRRPKPLLVDALEGLLPEEVWKRPKMGFTLPFQRWMRSALQSELEGTLSSEDGFTQLGVNPDYVREMWDAFKKNPQQEPWSRSWALYVLKRWCDLNKVRL